MSSVTAQMRQVVDWQAVIRAGIASGGIFLIILLLMQQFVLGSPWVIFRIMAAPVLGFDILPPPATFHLGATLVAMLLHFLLSVIFTALIATVLHRWGLIVGIVGGAVFGLMIYSINFYTMLDLFPLLFPLRSWMMLVSHIIFGALAGGFYEWMEVERFVPVDGEDA